MTEPSLIRYLNLSTSFPYSVLIKRPFTFLAAICYQYAFECKAEVLGHKYECWMSVRKLPLEKSGLQNINEEDTTKHKITMLKVSEYEWVWLVKELHGVVILDKPIQFLCTFDADSKSWKIISGFREINSLFTFNVLGDSLGVWAQMAEYITVEFYTLKHEVSLTGVYKMMRVIESHPFSVIKMLPNEAAIEEYNRQLDQWKAKAIQ